MASNSTKAASDAWESLMRAYSVMMKRFQEEGNWEELPVREYDVLYTLTKSGCAMTQKELLQGVLLSQPALSRLLVRLESQGLIERHPDPSDRRGTLVHLTDQGHQLQRRVGKAHAATIAKYLNAALTPEQLHQLGQITATITHRTLGGTHD